MHENISSITWVLDPRDGVNPNLEKTGSGTALIKIHLKFFYIVYTVLYRIRPEHPDPEHSPVINAFLVFATNIRTESQL